MVQMKITRIQLIVFTVTLIAASLTIWSNVLNIRDHLNKKQTQIP
jgi:hypothetical protein